MKQIVLLIIIAGLVTCMGAHAQKIVYAYDLSGNCTTKTYSTSKSSTTGGGTEVVDAKQNDFETILMTGENSIKIYPNPNSGQFQIEMTGFDEALDKGTISIFSARGQMVLKLSSLQQLNSFNLSNQPNGTYVLQINVDSKTYTHKFIIFK